MHVENAKGGCTQEEFAGKGCMKIKFYIINYQYTISYIIKKFSKVHKLIQNIIKMREVFVNHISTLSNYQYPISYIINLFSKVHKLIQSIIKI